MLNGVPDQVHSFGRKVNWFAIRIDDPTVVIDALAMGSVAAVN